MYVHHAVSTCEFDCLRCVLCRHVQYVLKHCTKLYAFHCGLRDLNRLYKKLLPTLSEVTFYIGGLIWVMQYNMHIILCNVLVRIVHVYGVRTVYHHHTNKFKLKFRNFGCWFLVIASFSLHDEFTIFRLDEFTMSYFEMYDNINVVLALTLRRRRFKNEKIWAVPTDQPQLPTLPPPVQVRIYYHTEELLHLWNLYCNINRQI